MTAMSVPLPDGFLAAVEHAHQEAARGFTGDRRAMLEAVSWLSAHLAAVGRVVHPAASRALPDGRQRVADQQRSALELQRVLWQLDRHLTGDVRSSHVAIPVLLRRLEAQLARHERGERALLVRLTQALPAERLAALGTAYADALADGPTRPHPHTIDRPGLRRVAFALEAAADRIRDALDSRHSPTRSPAPPPRPQGRWTVYLFGGPHR